MKQKFRIDRQFDPRHDMLFYYGYRYVFFNLVPVYFVLGADFDEVKKKLLLSATKYAKVTISIFWSE